MIGYYCSMTNHSILKSKNLLKLPRTAVFNLIRQAGIRLFGVNIPKGCFLIKFFIFFLYVTLVDKIYFEYNIDVMLRSCDQVKGILLT